MAPSEVAGVPIDQWLDACRRMVASQQELYARTSGIAARTEYAGVGEGGDRSLVIDRQAEDIVFRELERLHRAGGSFTAISEERGEVPFGDGGDLVVIDPIDGSLNARRTLPSFALSVAVASGPSMADVEFGYVWDFGAGEEFVALRGAGARLDGEELEARGPGYGLEVVGLEATKPELVAPIVAGLEGRAYRLRGIGSLALSVCYVAAGRLDGMLSGRPSRSVDVAAAQLIAREAGASVEFVEVALTGAHLDLAARFDIAAALDEEMLGSLLEVQREAAAERA
jgi:myo-inositol-1(or 4)-monophosphatase